MAEKPTDDGRFLALNTTLGKDKLLVQSVTAFEGMSRLFRFQLELVSPDKQIKPEDVIGTNVSIKMELAPGQHRFFHGIVNRFNVGDSDVRFGHYQAEVVPAIWRLTLTSDCRIFPDTSVPQVIEKILGEHNLKNFRMALDKSKFTKWDYCVQYRETDFNFLSRLMEQEGIFYFFEHDDKLHTVVFADTLASCTPCPGVKEARYNPAGGTGDPEQDTVDSWVMTHELRPGKVTLRDWHLEKPNAKDLEVNRPTAIPVSDNTKFEVFDYPGEYAQRFNKPGERLDQIKPEGEKIARIRMEEEETPHLIARGSSGIRAFSTGRSFNLTKHPSFNGNFVLTAVQFTATQTPPHFSGAGLGIPYNNGFSCVAATAPYRPARVSAKPVIQGLQNAIVVGPAGKEIDVDRWGRVRVQFPWDREGKMDGANGCFIRVVQPWAGKNWGAFFWPRIGQEVLVAFVEGDPEQPLIVGSVYNSDQPPPYLGVPGKKPSPDSKHPNDPNLSGIKSNSTLDGVGFNEIRFDDTKDKQQVFLHAERNMDARVKNESMEGVLLNRHLIVGGVDKNGKKVGDQREQIFQDKHLNVKRNQVEQIEGNLQLTVGKGEADDGGNLDILVEKQKNETIEKDSGLHVKGSRAEQVDGAQSLTVGGDQQEKVSKNHALDAGMAIHIKAGTTLILEAGVQLSLKVGGNFIDIGPAGVAISGMPMVMINSGGAAGSGAGSSPAAPTDAKQAQPTKPTEADNAKTGSKSAPQAAK